ncbi:hypothetical protein BCR44DRAFT_1484144 [Catenaria anguillulae PL171]|uniref:Peptidase C14 caspase domain-containing protein n=1 Tax=Catenaria anguillulae PL171 TaxID=765915 RepID=A0A1Y2HRQ1_9FUNG|nr:hypothetical protein BCR44DRAFT_1484144 [Catenaria anguillulae PL171]
MYYIRHKTHLTMPNTAFIAGLTYPADPSGSIPLPGMAVASDTVASLAASTGLYTDGITHITDQDEPVTREVLLRGLMDACANAQPGDNIFLGLFGHGIQVSDATGREEDGMHELFCTSDGQAVLDNEIQAILSELPAGVNVTMCLDCCNSGTLADLDLGGIDANVVSISSAVDGQSALVQRDGSGTYFVREFERVMEENPELSWVEAVELMNERLPKQWGDMTINLHSNDAELLQQPMFTVASKATEPDNTPVVDDVDDGDEQVNAQEDGPADLATLGIRVAAAERQQQDEQPEWEPIGF